MKNNIILESNNGRRFKLVVDDNGILGTKEVPAPCRPGYEVKFLVAPDLVLNSDGSYKDEFKNLYSDWDITKFANDEIELYKEFNICCTPITFTLFDSVLSLITSMKF